MRWVDAVKLALLDVSDFKLCDLDVIICRFRICA